MSRPGKPTGKKSSAGILLFRLRADLEVLIAHPGGPFWRSRDRGAWSIPKGLLRPGEAAIGAARREFEEETGLSAPATGLVALGSIKQLSGKTVHAWAYEGDADAGALVSNTFTMEWPHGSGKIEEFPEMDRFLWASPTTARSKLNRAQGPFVDRLEEMINRK